MNVEWVHLQNEGERAAMFRLYEISASNENVIRIQGIMESASVTRISQNKQNKKNEIHFEKSVSLNTVFCNFSPHS